MGRTESEVLQARVPVDVDSVEYERMCRRTNESLNLSTVLIARRSIIFFYTVCDDPFTPLFVPVPGTTYSYDIT